MLSGRVAEEVLEAAGGLELGEAGLVPLTLPSCEASCEEPSSKTVTPDGQMDFRKVLVGPFLSNGQSFKVLN